MIKLRNYQTEAVDNFKNNGFNGLFEMATGTGKTITSLACANEHYLKKGKQFLVIIVPFLHLIDQWVDDFGLFDIKNYHVIAYAKKKWLPNIESLIWDYNNGFRNRVVLIGSYKSIADKDFLGAISKIKKSGCVLADECHYLGSESISLSEFSGFDARIGLSATPQRWWDDEGTSKIERFFDKTVFQFTLSQAISEGYLTNYRYHPIQVQLTLEEIEEYERLTFRIAVLYNKKNKTIAEKEQLEKLLLNRTKIIKSAANKKEILIKMLRQTKEIHHAIVYCAEGEVDFVVNAIAELGIRVHRFNSEIPNKERSGILKRFDEGNIQILVAIKCLDEGVDIPATQTAYFLASTSNPKEFIQRRGRILRKYKGKIFAEVYDFIVLPSSADNHVFRSIAVKEMPRFAEFSSGAINSYESKQTIMELLEKHNLEHLTEIKPWDVYKNMRNEDENEYSTGYTM